MAKVMTVGELMKRYCDRNSMVTMFSRDRAFLQSNKDAEVVAFIACESPHRKRDTYDQPTSEQWTSEVPVVAFVMKDMKGDLYGFSDWMREDVRLVLSQIDETKLHQQDVDEKRHPDVARRRLIDSL